VSRAAPLAAIALAASLVLLRPTATRAQNGPSDWSLDALEAGPAAAPTDTTGWGGNADLGFTLTAGNSKTTNLSVGGKVAYRLKRQAWTLSGQYLRATTDGDQTANRGTGALQYDVYPTARFFVFARAQAGFDKPAGLSRRLAPAVGVGYQVVATNGVTLSLQGGGSWIQDRFVNDSTDAAVHAAIGEALTWTVSETTDLTQSLIWSPKASDFGQYLVHGELGLTTRIVGGLGLSVNVQDDYNSDPFVDPGTGLPRKKNDLTLVTGVSYKF
jgi:putative salt-induced outer membrane protein